MTEHEDLGSPGSMAGEDAGDPTSRRDYLREAFTHIQRHVNERFVNGTVGDLPPDVARVYQVLKRAVSDQEKRICATCAHLRRFEVSDETMTCPVVNIRIHAESIDVFGCNLHKPKTADDALPAWPVYHRVQRKNRRGALTPCSGVAFYRRVRGPIPVSAIPATCETCGQRLEPRHLDLGELIDVRKSQHRAAVRPRHHGPKGCPVVESEAKR